MAEDTIVQRGDCISSLAQDHGLFWETVWNHPKNSELKKKRKDPNILLAGDIVHIPDIRPRVETRPTDQRHDFRRKGVPAKLRIRLLKPEEPNETAVPRGGAPPHGARHVDDGDAPASQKEREIPRSNTPYVLKIDGVESRGQTDGDGYLEVAIPPNAKEGSLTIDPGTALETVLPLHLGHLDPLEEISGVKQRLANLGFDCGDRTDEVTDDLRVAVRAFQQMHGLTVNGEPDAATRDKLKSVHGS